MNHIPNRESQSNAGKLLAQPQSTAALNNTVNFDDSSEEGGLDLGQIARGILRRLWIVALGTTVGIVGAGVWSRTRAPAYEGSFKILIEPVTAEAQVASAIINGERVSVEERDLGSAQFSKTTLDYPTQIQLLLSDKILSPVAKQLAPKYPKISYETLKTSLNISRLKDPSETKILEIRYKSTVETEVAQVLKLVSHAYVQYSLNERQTNVRRAVKFVETQLPKVQTQVRKLESELQSFRQKYKSIDPTTLGNQLGDRLSTIQKEKQATHVELAKAKKLYESLGRQLQMQPQGAEAASVLSDAPGYQALLKQLQELDVEIKIQSAQLTEEHPKLILLRERRAKLLPLLQQQANATLGSNIARNIPTGQSLPYQNQLRQDLSKQYITAATQMEVLTAQLKSLDSVSQALSTDIDRLPEITRQYENLQRQLKLVTEQQSKFLQKREELNIDAARQEVPWEIVAPTNIRQVSASSLPKDALLGGVAGLLLGIGGALVIEKSSKTIYSIKDLREEIDLPILGTIPPREQERKTSDRSGHLGDDSGSLDERSGSLLAADNTHNRYYQFSPFLESFRALNSQIRLLDPDRPIRSLVISSSVPSEGKTTIALQLAQAAAAMGQRVLLVNADLRKSSIEEPIDRPHNQRSLDGLTDAIAGNCDLMDTVQLLPGEEKLYVLLAGSVVADPTSVLSSHKMQELMHICERNFDLVIYDTVPLSFADSLLLIPYTDGLLMVARLGTVDREVLRNSLRTLAVSKVPVFGLVVNMVNSAQSSTSAYYKKRQKSNLRSFVTAKVKQWLSAVGQD